MKFQKGDSVVASRRSNIDNKTETLQQVGIITKTSDVSSETYPDRSVYSITFPLEPQTPVTFVWAAEGYWVLPDKSQFDTVFNKITRGKEVLWELN